MRAITILRKVWTVSIQHAFDPSLSHESGDFKLTWQVISDAGLYNYEIRNNAVYRDAMEAMKEGERAAEIEQGSSDEEDRD